MRWITHEKVRVDRVACPWLIKKFIDSEAEIVRAADSRSRRPHPAGEGLRWITHGFSAP